MDVGSTSCLRGVRWSATGWRKRERRGRRGGGVGGKSARLRRSQDGEQLKRVPMYVNHECEHTHTIPGPRRCTDSPALGGLLPSRDVPNTHGSIRAKTSPRRRPFNAAHVSRAEKQRRQRVKARRSCRRERESRKGAARVRVYTCELIVLVGDAGGEWRRRRTDGAKRRSVHTNTRPTPWENRRERERRQRSRADLPKTARAAALTARWLSMFACVCAHT